MQIKIDNQTIDLDQTSCLDELYSILNTIVCAKWKNEIGRYPAIESADRLEGDLAYWLEQMREARARAEAR